MKKLLLILVTLMGITLQMNAQDDGLKYVNGSFKDRADIQNSLSGSGMGAQDLAPTTYFQQENGKYAKDENGDDTAAALVIYIKNMLKNEIEKVSVTIEGAQVLNRYEKNLKGKNCIIVHVRGSEIGKKYNKLRINHEQFGEAIFYNPVFTTGHIYEIEFVNARKVTVNISSTPNGATVYLDGNNYGPTPKSIPNVSMGEHELYLKAPNEASHDESAKIEVNDANTAFNYDLRKSRDVTFKASRNNARIEVSDPTTQKVLGSGYGSVALNNISFGGYKVRAYLDNKIVYDEIVEVNQYTPSSVSIAVTKKKAVNFVAYQNNTELKGASVTVDGQGNIGLTPITKEMEYGTYTVHMSSGGQSKDGKLTVNDNSKTMFKLILPNPYHYRSRWNPFDTDYKKREWGMSFSYINKQYLYTIKPKKGETGSTQKFKYNNWLEEDKMMHGMQMGIVYQPYFGYGQGLITGLFWQYFIGTAPVEDDPLDNEHNLMIPVLYQFRLPLGENCSIYASTGIEMVIGLAHSVSWGEDEEINLGFGYNDDYDLIFPKRTQFYVPLGVGFQYKSLQLEYRYSWGISDNKHVYKGINEEWNQSLKGQMMEASIQIVF